MDDADSRLQVRRLLAKYWIKKIQLGVLFSEVNLKSSKLRSEVEVECVFDAVASSLRELTELRDRLIKLGVSESELLHPSLFDR
jgi:hypothetical protein